MKITYSSPNRSHHYPYAEAINRANSLHSFVSGFSRFSPRANSLIEGDKVHRYDFFQNIYLASLKIKAPILISNQLTRSSAKWLDYNSYQFAKNSDAFIFYRSHGFNTTKRIHKEKLPVICIMEEVNSHIENMESLLKREFEQLKLGKYKSKIPDRDIRLKTYDEADYILCPSKFVRNSFIEKGFEAAKLITVNFGFPLTELANTAIRKDNGKFKVLFVGQIHYRKGLRYAIEAFKKINHPNKEFVIVGPITKETGLESISIPKNVIFTGPLKGDDLRHQYRSSDVFVLPSIEEGLALVQGEALVNGLPLIITTNTGGADIITDGGEGFIVPPFDTEALKEKLQILCDSPNLRYKMSENALITAKRLGNWDFAANKLITNLEKLILR